MASRPWIFVCPSSRGIGQALVRRLLRDTNLPVLATTRQRDTDTAKAALLAGLGPTGGDGLRHGDAAARLHLFGCDVTDPDSVREAACHAEVLFPRRDYHLHLAFAIPGILRPEKSPLEVEADQSIDSFRVNAIGPLLLAKHFFPFLPRRSTPEASGLEADGDAPADGTKALLSLPRHATWVNMAARLGSTADNRSGGWYSYRASKAAVISLTRSLDLFLAARSGDRALALAYHPGTVATDFSRAFWGGVPEGKLFERDYAVERMLQLVCRADVGQRGRCWDWKGDEVPP